MDPITTGIVLALLGGLGYVGLKNKPNSEDKSLDQENEIKSKLKDATLIPIPSIERWVQVEADNGNWLVSPIYIAPVAIGEAQKIADLNGFQLPTPALVDAIWKAADLKLDPNPRMHDGTPKTMNSDEMNISQLAYIKKQIDEKSPNWDFKLLAGSHKDVVKTKDGKLGLYGWQKLPSGKNIQGLFTGHGLDWKDYSQGARLVKKIS